MSFYIPEQKIYENKVIGLKALSPKTCTKIIFVHVFVTSYNYQTTTFVAVITTS